MCVWESDCGVKVASGHLFGRAPNLVKVMINEFLYFVKPVCVCVFVWVCVCMCVCVCVCVLLLKHVLTGFFMLA